MNTVHRLKIYTIHCTLTKFPHVRIIGETDLQYQYFVFLYNVATELE